MPSILSGFLKVVGQIWWEFEGVRLKIKIKMFKIQRMSPSSQKRCLFPSITNSILTAVKGSGLIVKSIVISGSNQQVESEYKGPIQGKRIEQDKAIILKGMSRNGQSHEHRHQEASFQTDCYLWARRLKGGNRIFVKEVLRN